MNAILKFAGVVSLALGLAACGSSSSGTSSSSASSSSSVPPALGTVVDVAVENGNFMTLVTALQETGLDELLADPEGNFTVFAPTDAAFDLLPEGTLEALLEDLETLSHILEYHVIADARIDAAGAIAAAGDTVETANGSSVGISLAGSNVMINLSMVTLADVNASNGIIHVIDAVLMPPVERDEPTQTIAEIASETESLSTLVVALDAANLVATLDDEEERFTVFAPTNDAFAVLGEENIDALLADGEALEAVLLQHVIMDAEVTAVQAYAANGTNVTMANGAEIPVAIQERVLRVGGAAVTVTDIYATNGVIHIIDMVIVGDLELPAPPQSIVDIAVANGNFTTLVAALEATGLDETLADLEGRFTVFAPTDAAFDALPEGTVEALLEDLPTLEKILLYHVIVGSQVLADAAINLANAEDSLVEMGNEQDAGLSLSGESLLINLSEVTTPNVLADNGVIHVIDKVMMPPAEVGEPTASIADVVAGDENFSTLLTALEAANLVGALDDETETYTIFAPTDAAFALIPEEDLNALIADEVALTEVLLTHVFSGAAISSVVAFTANGTSLEMMSENSVSVEIVAGTLQVGGSTVTTFDIYTTNGVIHVIDAVILP